MSQRTHLISPVSGTSILSSAAILLSALLCAGASSADAPPIYREPYRPQIHYTPPAHWMNDPNGLIQIGGEYHMYYQYYPEAMVWGPMHWGHATSPDLIHWRTENIALAPDTFGAIFSGSTVLDERNSSGLGQNKSDPLVAIYTYHNHDIEKAGGLKIESQGLAYSLDQGKTFEKIMGPVLENPGKRDFRDPQVQWNADSQRWIMTLVATDHVEFYSSQDLRHWELESTFGHNMGDHTGVWECPGLVRMIGVDDHLEHDLLVVSVGPTPPNHRGGVQYFTGHFDGHQFLADPASRTEWLDDGPDFYAAAFWNRDKTPVSEPPVLLGWMSNWLYALKVPTSPWRGAMAIPRTLTLRQRDGRNVIESRPVSAVEGLRQAPIVYPDIPVGSVIPFNTAPDNGYPAYELTLSGIALASRDTHLVISNEQGESVHLIMSPALNSLTLDRRHSGDTQFDGRFADVITASLRDHPNLATLRILIDQSSLEVFVNDGATVMTAQIFPSTPYDRFSVSEKDSGGPIDVTVYPLRSIWSAGNP